VFDSDRLITRLTQIPGTRSLWRRMPVGSLGLRVRYGIWSRPHYAFGVYTAADLGRRLNLPGISVVEFGVAGGNGLIALEQIAREVSAHFKLPITVYGFDTGEGMPPPEDYRDLPFVWEQGYYKMDPNALQARLNGSRLMLGDVGETVPKMLSEPGLHPLGFVAFDLDYYSSTMRAFRIFEGPAATRLPRVMCYFDDTIWPEIACHNEYTGELGAIRDFNAQHQRVKLCEYHGLKMTQPHPAAWHDQTYVLHDFEHSLYTVNITPSSDRYRQLPLAR